MVFLRETSKRSILSKAKDQAALRLRLDRSVWAAQPDVSLRSTWSVFCMQSVPLCS